MASKVDTQVKANLDRIDRRKMNRIQRVQSLPARGGSGDWVVRTEKARVDNEDVDFDVTYAWVDDA